MLNNKVWIFSELTFYGSSDLGRPSYTAIFLYSHIMRGLYKSVV